MDAPYETALQLLGCKLNFHHRLSDRDQQAILGLQHKIRRLEAQSYILRVESVPTDAGCYSKATHSGTS